MLSEPRTGNEAHAGNEAHCVSPRNASRTTAYGIPEYLPNITGNLSYTLDKPTHRTHLFFHHDA